MTIAQIRRDNEQYRKANPWIIQNLQCSDALCGRYPSREAAEAQGASYRGGVVDVSESQRIVYVSSMPCL